MGWNHLSVPKRSLRNHVANVCRSINLYSIGKIRKYLDRPNVEMLVNATITSRLDYWNSLMFDISKELITPAHNPTPNASKSCSSWHRSMAQIRPHYTCPRRSALAPRKALILRSFCLLSRPWMDSHQHTYVNSSFSTPQRALCDPRKTNNWYLCDVRPWTF